MINHVLHDNYERMKDTITHYSMWLYQFTTSWVHNIVVYVCIVSLVSECGYIVNGILTVDGRDGIRGILWSS